MSRRIVFAALTIVLVPALASAQEKKSKDIENPYKNAKVGDWATYSMIATAMGQKQEGTVKVVVTAKDDKEVTLKTSGTVGGKEAPAMESKIDLTKPYDPLSTAGLPKGDDVKVEKLEEGKEKIKVGDKEYEANWMKLKVATKTMGVDFTAETKVWLVKEIPLGGMAKMEMKSQLFDMAMQLKETGSEKK
jgi:hypothetical protein